MEKKNKFKFPKAQIYKVYKVNKKSKRLIYISIYNQNCCMDNLKLNV